MLDLEALVVPIVAEYHLAEHRLFRHLGHNQPRRVAIAFQRTVREIYLDATVRDPHFLRIDCAGEDGSMLPPEQIFQRLTAPVEALL